MGVGRGRGAIIDAESGTSGVGENGEAINTKPRARGVAGYEMLCWEWGGGPVVGGWDWGARDANPLCTRHCMYSTKDKMLHSFVTRTRIH